MAKLKSSFLSRSSSKLPALGGSLSSTGGSSKTAAPRDLAAKLLSPASRGSAAQPLKFGSLHTKQTGATSSGTQWTNLLSTASGGVTSFLGGGLVSSGGLGFIGSLLNLFGGGKATPTAPVAFQSPVSQHESINVAIPGGTSSVSLGVHSSGVGGANAGIYQQTGTTVASHYSQSIQVVQIVKQALLTSSSLNDVISEI